MGKRAKADKRAIEESAAPAVEPHQESPDQLARDDVDKELFSFFSGGYAGELGLRSATGAQIDRLAFSMGPSLGRQPDGYNDAVRFGVSGPQGLLEVGRVERALRALCEPQAAPAPPAAGTLPPDARAVRRAAQRPHYFAALKGYYRPRPPGAFDGILVFAEFAGVVLVLPGTQALADAWRADERARDLQANAAGVASARVKSEERQGLRRGALRMTLATKGSRLRAAYLERQIAAGDRPVPRQDTEAAIRSRWATSTEAHALSALRQLVKRANARKDSPDRDEAKALVAALRDEAAALWEGAKFAYKAERKRVDRAIRSEGRAARKGRAELDRMRDSLRGTGTGDAD